MGVLGQFSVFDEWRHLPCYGVKWKHSIARQINGKVAACAIYSLVFAA